MTKPTPTLGTMPVNLPSLLETRLLIVANSGGGITRDEVAAAVGMTASGGTFSTYLGDLRRNGLITEQGKRCTANDILFPKGGRDGS